nr:MAG TPA: hypothetical protein [Caudoviricetes sp.]
MNESLRCSTKIDGLGKPTLTGRSSGRPFLFLRSNHSSVYEANRIY